MENPALVYWNSDHHQQIHLKYLLVFYTRNSTGRSWMRQLRNIPHPLDNMSSHHLCKWFRCGQLFQHLGWSRCMYLTIILDINTRGQERGEYFISDFIIFYTNIKFLSMSLIPPPSTVHLTTVLWYLSQMLVKADRSAIEVSSSSMHRPKHSSGSPFVEQHWSRMKGK